MRDAIERVIHGLERGRLTRRQAVTGLTALVGAALAGPPSLARKKPPAPTFQSQGLNHVALRVSDLRRSSAFYREHLGLRVLRESRHNTFLGCGGNNFVALFRAERAGLDHFCFTVPDYDASRTVQRLEAAGLEPERHEDRVYFEDPDGITVQLTGEWDDYPGERPD